ncbi:flavin-containing monooxygenase [Nocardiopsis dassonvillei]|uniref:flavin-containing monooxygenase n=1 Tax=Nocardiopsis dassonvillei TaxID=2014 RepID=UPI00366D2E51
MAPAAHRVLDTSVPPRTLPQQEVARHAEEGDHASLLMSLVQVTGDTGLLDRFGPHLRLDTASGGLVPAGRLPREQASEVVASLAEALSRASQSPYLQVPDAELFGRMISLATGTEVGGEFVPLIREQAGFEPAVPVIARTSTAPEGFRVAVLGAGMAGIAAAIGLADTGFSYEVIEAADDIGGTWRINTYPGVAVDTPSIYYSYSFEPEPGWSRLFPTGAEYQDYLRRVVDKYGVKRNIRFNTTITSLTWDEQDHEWIIKTLSGGEAGTSRANAVITAAGFLNRPKYPDLPGRDSFAGTSVHTAAWDQSLDLRGKRVGVVGAGATSVQVVDAVADAAEHLTLFQRQPHWVMPNYVGEGLVSDHERWLQSNIPFYDRWQRARAYWFVSDVNYPSTRVDPEWTATHDVSISESNDRYMRLCLGHLEASFGHDPVLRAAMTPDFPVHGKRIVRDPGRFYSTLASDKADVVTAPLAEIVPEGIRTLDGRLVELDVIVYATGFTLDFLSTVEITGRDGVRLTERWADNDPRSYLGGTVPGFPNLFVTSGPNSSSGHGGGHNFMTEAVVHYITECLQLLVERGASSIEATEQAQEEFVAAVDEQMEGSVWRHSWSAHTYYRNEQGRVLLPNPWRMVDFWTMLRTPDESKFVLRRKEN